MEEMRNLFLRSQCFNKKFFLTKPKKEDRINMGIIYMSFLSRNLLCKNIYTVSSFMWSNKIFTILKWMTIPSLYFFSFSFLTYEVSYSKNTKFFRRNAEIIFEICFQTVICGIYFCDWLIKNKILRIKFLRFRAKINKISSATIYDHKNFCP